MVRSEALANRIQLLLIFPDVQLAWNNNRAVLISNQEFMDYVDELRTQPNSEAVEAYRQAIQPIN